MGHLPVFALNSRNNSAFDFTAFGRTGRSMIGDGDARPLSGDLMVGVVGGGTSNDGKDSIGAAVELFEEARE